jgi:phosphopantetheinyl transferase (holo-ACP synthase)
MFTRTIHTSLVEGLAALGHGLEAIAMGSSNSARRNDLVSKVHKALRECNNAIAKEDELHKLAARNEAECHASTMWIAKETCASAMGNMHKKMANLNEQIVKDLKETARIQSTGEETIALVEGMNDNDYEEWDRRLSELKGDCLIELVKSKNNLFLSMKLVELKVKMDAERISSRLNSSSSSSSEDDNHDNNNTVSSHATNRGGVIKTVNTLIHLTTSISQQGKEEEGDNEEEEEEEQYHQVLAQVP